MKTRFLFLVIVISLLSAPAQAAFYQWTDADGVVHFTDARKKIPPKYRSKARKVNVIEDRPSTRTPAVQSPPVTGQGAPAAGQTPPAAPAAGQVPLSPGGHDEQWWRERFAALRKELNVVRQGLSQKQAKLVELRRRRAIYTRIEDREAVNAMQSAIAADETRETELLRQVDLLDQEATRAGVPVEWRQ